VELRIPFATLLKIAFAVLLVFVVVKLWPMVLMVIVSILLAVMFDALVVWMEGHGVRRGIAITIVALLVLGVLAALVFILGPILGREIGELAKQWPKLKQQIGAKVPQLGGLLQIRANQLPQWIPRGLLAGKLLIEAITALIFVLVLAIYLVIEGRRAFAWLVSFAPPPQRKKLERTAREVSPVVLAYMRGQAITCALSGAWAYLVLTVLHVPAALPLALLAVVADLVPVVGTVVMTVPAVLFALLVGPVQALIVFAAYMFYNLVESYFIIPRVYGNQMRLSTLTVLLAVAVGGMLQGALGAILILPLVAAYPIVERIWLRDKLPDDTVARHEKIESSA
jgi:predicted PurR-regulated permease PerM